jgi:hypothetical protein
MTVWNDSVTLGHPRLGPAHRQCAHHAAGVAALVLHLALTSPGATLSFYTGILHCHWLSLAAIR